MLIILSPAKTLDFKREYPPVAATVPEFLDKASGLMTWLICLSPVQIQELMEVSPAMAIQCKHFFKEWDFNHHSGNARPAVYAYNGDVYRGLEYRSLSEQDRAYGSGRLRILSGLYGVLKPFDLIQPYRLEMGLRLPVGRKRDLISFWREPVSQKLTEEVKATGNPVLLNLASREYTQVFEKSLKGIQVISPEFREYRNGSYQMVSVFAKKARGLMARFVIQNRIERPDDLPAFDLEGYCYNVEKSHSGGMVFTRG